MDYQLLKAIHNIQLRPLRLLKDQCVQVAAQIGSFRLIPTCTVVRHTHMLCNAAPFKLEHASIVLITHAAVYTCRMET